MKINTSVKKRIVNLIVAISLALAIGLLYYVSFRYLDVSVPCIFRKLTGLYCPGCGLTRMCSAILEGDLIAAFGYNPLCFVLLPFFIFLAIRYSILYVKNGNPLGCGRLDVIMLSALVFLLFIFAVLRNIPSLSFLAPSKAL
jgi:hypothetical protein